MNSIVIEKYRNSLIQVTNNCNLSIGTAYYVMKDVLKELELEYIHSQQRELNEMNKQENIETLDIPSTTITEEIEEVPINNEQEND